MTTTTTNMSMILPDVSVTVGPDWATLVNAALVLNDAHDHSSGKGIKVTPSGLNISSDLTFAQNNATNLRTARLYNNSSITLGVNDKTCLYSLNDELYYVDGAGNDIQVTIGGAINIGSTSALTLNDSSFILQYFGDTSRKVKFSAASIPVSTTRTLTLADSGANDTIPTLNSTSVMKNKVLSDTTTTIGEVSDNTKAVKFSLSGATTAKTTTIVSAQTDNRNITLPDATGTVVLKDTTDSLTNKSFNSTTTILGANLLTFNNSGNTYGTSLAGGANSANATLLLPITVGSSGQVLTDTDGAGTLGWSTPASTVGNVAANDSNVTFTNADNRTQICLPTAARTYTLPTTSIVAGDRWNFFNQSAFLITVNASGGAVEGYIYPYSNTIFTCLSNTPTTAAHWDHWYGSSEWVSYTPTFTGFGTVSSVGFQYKISGDSLLIRGILTLGTTTAVTSSMTIPTGLTIGSSKLGASNTTSGNGCVLGTRSSSDGNAGSVVSATGTSTTLVYFGASITSSNNLSPQLGSNLTSSITVSLNLEVPLV